MTTVTVSSQEEVSWAAECWGIWLSLTMNQWPVPTSTPVTVTPPNPDPPDPVEILDTV